MFGRVSPCIGGLHLWIVSRWRACIHYDCRGSFFIKNLCTHYHCDECAFSISGLFSDKESVHFSDEEYMHSVSLNCSRMKNLCIQYHCGLFLDEECEFTITVDCFWMKSVHSVSPWIVFR